MRTTPTLALIALVVFASAAFADEPTTWLNVHVTETSENADVRVHLPMDLVLAVLNGISVENFDRGMVDLDLEMADTEIDWAQLIQAVRTSPDGEYVTITSDEADVRVVKQAGMMLVDVLEKAHDHAEVQVRIPVSMLDAFSVDEQNRFDVAAFLRSFDERPDGELVRVTSNEANVRVWVE